MINQPVHEARASVEYDGKSFEVLIDEDGASAIVTSGLAIDDHSAGLRYEVIPFVRNGLTENLILEVHLKRQDVARIGWLIPANALSSSEHDFAENIHFLRYAYVAMEQVLLRHVHVYAEALRERVGPGSVDVPFADLFNDDVCFLVICLDLAERNGPPFDSSTLIPTLVSYGFIPLAECEPGSSNWSCREIEVGVKSIKIQPTGAGIKRADLPARLFSVAASARGSAVTRFFYFYQVVELLMEEVLLNSLHSIGQSVRRAIEMEQHIVLRDELEGLSGRFSEKERLKVLMQSFQGGESAVAELAEASDEFLQSVGVDARSGIGGLYQVRNYVVHQVRHMPTEAEEILERVSQELAAFLPKVLSTFSMGERPPSRIEELNEEFYRLRVLE